MIHFRSLLRVSVASLGLLVAAPSAMSQVFPSKPVRIIVPFPAGGLTDVVARALGQDLTRAWGQTVIVENKPGANQQIAADFVAKAPGDSHMHMFADKTSLAILPALYSKLPYDPVKDFTPVVGIMQTANALVVAPSLNINTWAEFVAAAKARPGKINYGSFGIGSVTHLDSETMAGLAGISLNHIPYKGIAEVLPAVASGQIETALSGISPLIPLLKQNRLKALAISATARSPVLPDVPTFTELGIPYVGVSWFGLVGPSGIPRPVVDKVATDVGRVVGVPEFREKYITGVGLEPFNLGPDQLAQQLNNDRARYVSSVKAANIKLD